MSAMPERIMFTELAGGCQVSTVIGKGGILADGLYETCVFYPDGYSEVVKQTWNFDEAFQSHTDWIHDLLG